MGGFTLAAVFIAAWVGIGLLTGLWMARRGHGDPLWLLIAVCLGPIFVPIACERVERRPRLAATGPSGPPSARPPGRRKLRILVGMDGSPASLEAYQTALERFGSRSELFVLAEVVPYDAIEDDGRGWVRDASERLARTASRAVGVPVTYEVLSGPPGEALRRFAQAQDVDLLVIGSHTRCLSSMLLGNVCADLIHHAPTPLLVAGQAIDRDRDRDRHRRHAGSSEETGARDRHGRLARAGIRAGKTGPGAPSNGRTSARKRDCRPAVIPATGRYRSRGTHLRRGDRLCVVWRQQRGFPVDGPSRSGRRHPRSAAGRGRAAGAPG